MVQHNAMAGNSLHELKGVESADDNTVATAVNGVTVWAKVGASNLEGTSNPFGGQLLHVAYIVNNNDDDYSGSNWTDRNLNTILKNQITSPTPTLSSSRIQLGAGDYIILARCPAYGVHAHVSRLYDETSDRQLILGSTSYAEKYDPGEGLVVGMSDSIIMGWFNLGGTKYLRLQTKGEEPSTFGMGKDAGFGSNKYSEAMIWRVGT